jgi:TetR/AcrR family transcriptional regulator
MARPKTPDPEVRAKIVKSAEHLFAARGYSGAAIRDIARSAGVNSAMIHYYFGNKEGLYHSILETAAIEVREKLLKTISTASSADQRLSQFVHAYATYIFSHPDLARILHRELLAGGPHLKEIAQQTFIANYEIAREWMRRGVRSRELRPIDTDLAPISLIGMILIFQIAQPLISVTLGRNRYDEKFVQRIADHTVNLFLTGAGSNRPAGSKAATRRGSKRKPAKTQSKRITRG